MRNDTWFVDSRYRNCEPTRTVTESRSSWIWIVNDTAIKWIQALIQAKQFYMPTPSIDLHLFRCSRYLQVHVDMTRISLLRSYIAFDVQLICCFSCRQLYRIAESLSSHGVCTLLSFTDGPAWYSNRILIIYAHGMVCAGVVKDHNLRWFPCTLMT